MFKFKAHYGERLPVYIILSFISVIAVWSVFLPKILDRWVGNANAAEFLPPLEISNVGGTSAEHQIMALGDDFYAFYMDTTNYDLVVASSSDGFIWGTERSIDLTLAPTSSLSVGYHTGAGYFYATYFDSSNESGYMTFATSADAITWTTSSPYASAGTGERIEFAFSTSSEMMMFAYSDNTSGDIQVSTSSDGGSWTNEIVVDETGILSGSGVSLFPVGAGISGAASSEILHVAFFKYKSDDTYGPATLVYASSSDYGLNWSTSTIKTNLEIDFGVGKSPVAAWMSDFELDGNGSPGIVYPLTYYGAFGGGALYTTSSLEYATTSDQGVTWTTSTLDYGMDLTYTFDDEFKTRAELMYFSDTYPLISYSRLDDDKYPILVDNTEGSFASSTVFFDAAQLFSPGITAVAYNTSTSFAAVSYIDTTGAVQMALAPVAIAAAPDAPSSATIDPGSLSTTDVYFSWTDNSSDEDGFVVQYSTDNSTFITFTTTSADAVGEVITGLTANTEYYFRVHATNSTGESSNAVVTNSYYTFSDNTIFSVATTTKTHLLFVDGTYHVFYTNNPTSSDHNIYYSSSEDAGAFWRPILEPVVYSVEASLDSSALFDVEYNTSSEYFMLTTQSLATNGINFTTSSNGIEWSDQVAITQDGQGTGFSSIAAATSSSYMAVGFVNDESNYFQVATSSDGVTWTSSTLAATNSTGPNQMVGVGVSGASGSEIIHAAYYLGDSSDSDPDGKLYYATSTDGGVSWETIVIADNLDVSVGGQFLAWSNQARFSLDDNGNPGLLYYQINSADQQAGFNYYTTSTLVMATSTLGSDWTSTTIATPGNGVSDITSQFRIFSDLDYFGTNNPIFTYYDFSDGYAHIGSVTTTVTTSTLVSETLATDASLAVAYDTTNEFGLSAYVYGTNLQFVTTSIATPLVVPSGLTTSTPSVTSMQLSWTDNSTNEDGVVVQYSIDGSSWTTYTTTSEDVVSETVTGLNTSTPYYFRVASTNSVETSDYVETGTGSYTLADAPGTPTFGTVTSTTAIPITIDASNNATSTTYAIYNSTDSTYVDSDGTSSATAVFYTTSTFGSDLAMYGLTANTEYSFVMIARNGTNTETATTSAATEYTDATVPSSVSATGGSEQAAVTWSGDGTEYAVQNVTSGTVGDWTTETSETLSGLTCNTTYSIKVKARNGDSVETDYSSAVSATTSACASSGGGGGSAGPAAPSLPTPKTVVTPTGEQTKVIPIGQSTQVSFGSASHTVTVLDASNSSVKVAIQSNPVVVSVKSGETEDVDTDNDGVNDIRLTYKGLVDGRPQLVLANIIDETSLAVTVNSGNTSTDKRDVTVVLNVPSATTVAIANEPTFAGVSYQPYKEEFSWTLSEGNELKTVYVRFRTKEGGVADAKDTILLTGQSFDVTVIEEEKKELNPNCALTVESAYRTRTAPGVFYITKDCTKRAFNSASQYFTYFTSWKSVNIASASEIEGIKDDELGFMPAGPLYDPQYGALVKIPQDPKVYLLLGNQKKWITSEHTFESLGYEWNWIEDVDTRLLDKYEVGGEITETNRHPDHTLFKYENSPKTYKLEDGKKRHIKNEAAFNKLKYRWDRIVTVRSTETYPDGEELE
jgi:hypothetical protein